MTTSKKVLSLQDKKEIIKALDEGAGQSGIKTAMAKTFGLETAIIKNRTRITGTYEQSILEPSRKRFRTAT